MAELQNDEIFQLFSASVAIRRASRTLDFAQFTMERAKQDALEFLGGDAVTLDGTDLGKFKSDTAALGKLDMLAIMEARVNQIVDSAIERSKGDQDE